MAGFANRFALLDEDADTTPAPAPSVEKKAEKATTAGAGKKDGAAGKPARGGRGGSYPSRGGPRKVFQEGGAAPAAGGDDAAGNDPVRDDRAGGTGGRGRGRGRGGRGGPRGGGRGRGNDRPDRHSQTDNIDSDKKEHQGWGGDEGKRELADEDFGAADARDEKGAETPKASGDWNVGDDSKPAANGDDDWGAQPDLAAASNDNTAAAASKDESAAAAPEPEPEDNSKTYEEWLAEKASAVLSTIGGALNIRKPNEGSDEAQWKSGKQLEKTGGTDDFFVGKQAQTKARKQKEDKRTFIEIEPTFERRREGGDRERGGRGGRGGFRGRGDGSGPRGRGEGFRGGRGRGRGDFSSSSRGGRGNQQAEVNLDDTSAFPSL